MRSFHNQTKPVLGFSLIEVLVAISVLAIVATIATLMMSTTLESSRAAKLDSDVATVNSAVKAYLASNGDLTSSTTPAEIVSKLKSFASVNSNHTLPGFSGSFLDPRIEVLMQTAEEAAAETPRAYWNSARNYFYVATGGPPGVKRFVINENLAEIPPTTEQRDSVMEYASLETWVWDYRDRTTSGPAGPTAISLATVPNSTPPSPPSPPPAPSPPPPPVASDLSPPLFSVASGSYPIGDFPLSLALANPNPPGSSAVIFRLAEGSWESYDGNPVDIPPATIVEAQALPVDTTAWNASPVTTETYGVTPERLAPPTILIGPGPNGAGSGEISVSLTNPNDSTISSLAIRIESGGWQPYAAPIVLPASTTDVFIEARAVAMALYYLDSNVTTETVPGQSVSNTIVIDADADTSIAKSVPNWTFDDKQLYSTADNSDPSATLIYFDLTDDIGGQISVESAVVYLTSTDPHGTDGPFPLHEILPSVNWVDGGLTWNGAGDGLSANDAELKATPEDTATPVAVIPGVPGASDRKKWDVTNLVQKWVDDPSTNNGFAVLATPGHREIFCHIEHLAEGVRPKMVVTWTPAPGSN